MKILLALASIGGLFVLEALRSRRARPIPKPVPETVVVHLTIDTRAFEEGMTALKEGMERLAAFFRDFGIRAAEAAAAFEVLFQAMQWVEVGEPEIPIDHSKCWRCQVTAVAREDELGLCRACIDHLGSL